MGSCSQPSLAQVPDGRPKHPVHALPPRHSFDTLASWTGYHGISLASNLLTWFHRRTRYAFVLGSISGSGGCMGATHAL
jgi:hypothetical protein